MKWGGTTGRNKLLQPWHWATTAKTEPGPNWFHGAGASLFWQLTTQENRDNPQCERGRQYEGEKSGHDHEAEVVRSSYSNPDLIAQAFSEFMQGGEREFSVEPVLLVSIPILGTVTSVTLTVNTLEQEGRKLAPQCQLVHRVCSFKRQYLNKMHRMIKVVLLHTQINI